MTYHVETLMKYTFQVAYTVGPYRMREHGCFENGEWMWYLHLLEKDGTESTPMCFRAPQEIAYVSCIDVRKPKGGPWRIRVFSSLPLFLGQDLLSYVLMEEGHGAFTKLINRLVHQPTSHYYKKCTSPQDFKKYLEKISMSKM